MASAEVRPVMQYTMILADLSRGYSINLERVSVYIMWASVWGISLSDGTTLTRKKSFFCSIAQS